MLRSVPGAPLRIDLNADLGEGFGPWSMGEDAAMLKIVTSANLACGGHAGDPDTMFATLQAAARQGVRVGAHPGYADREGFGRRVIPMSPAQITRMVAAQIGALAGVAALAGTRLSHVKPHGALANLAAADADVAAAIISATKAQGKDLILLAISGTVLDRMAREAGMTVASEVFADRGYLPDGQLMPRHLPGAVLHDSDDVCERLLAFLSSGEMPVAGGGSIPLQAQSICIHGDTAGAVEMAAKLRDRLRARGVTLAPFAP